MDENDKFLKNEHDIFTKLYGSMVGDGKAMVWTPFSSFKDGFNRILVRDISLRPGRLGRLVRRLVEIDLYVTISLKNFNMARRQLEELNVIENDVYKTLNDYQLTNISNYESCYEDIRKKSKEIANIIAQNRYNLQAVIAYSGLVWQRIDELREQYLEGWSRISFFLKKNFKPGVETCHSVIKSQMDVSQQIRGVANLLEAGLSLELQKNETERRKNEESFIEKIQIIALIPVSYYLSHIIDEITCHQLTWLVWLIVPPTSLYLSMQLLFTKTGNKKMENLLKLWKSEDKEKLYKWPFTKAIQAYTKVVNRWSPIKDK